MRKRQLKAPVGQRTVSAVPEIFSVSMNTGMQKEMMRMNLWEEAPKTELFGIQFYTFGMFCAIGLLFAATAILLLCRFAKRKKGTGCALVLMSSVFGLIGSRIAFIIFHGISVEAIPFFGWFWIHAGGWSLFGMVFGALFGGWICGKMTGAGRNRLLDILCCALPLWIAAERFGERYFEGFDISRELSENGFPRNTFLAVEDTQYDTSFLATYLLAAICAVCLFLILVFFFLRPGREDGAVFNLFLILCGAGGVVLESLRYDHYLEYSFVCFQQVMAAVLLVWGVAIAIRRSHGLNKVLSRIAGISLPLAIGACGGIEFALDRTTASHTLLYVLMIAALAVPAAAGILLIKIREKGTSAA